MHAGHMFNNNNFGKFFFEKILINQGGNVLNNTIGRGYLCQMKFQSTIFWETGRNSYTVDGTLYAQIG